MYGLEGQRAVVTGAAYGIGNAIASRLAGEGCAIALWDIDAASLETARADLARRSARVTAHLVDVSDLGQTSRALDATISAWGEAPDILVNNAGIGQVASILDATPEDFDRTMQVNVRGTFNCCHLVAPLMCKRRSGNIVNVASWFGKSGRPMSLAYCASKFAIVGMTQSMGLDLAKTGVRVNAVCPGTIADTRMREQADEAALSKGMLPAEDREHLIPLGRLGKPEDVARVVAFLVSNEAGYMTGQSINVTGGLWMN
jgi:2-hydroxycyclohexanecarboxyl-CoA dehydrogenase